MDFGKNINIANYNKNEIHGNEIHGNEIHGNEIHGNEIHGNEIHGNEIHDLEVEFNKMKLLVEKNESNMNEIISQKTTELNKAITELKAHSDLQTDFINIASHELRTPIQPILNQAELASQGIKPTNDALRIILKNAKHLSRLTEDILEVSRIERGSINYNFEKMNLSKLLYEIISNQKEKNDKVIPINIDVKSDVIIKADKIKLNQAISNVINNSIKFTKKGSISITQDISDEKDNVIITIADTGSGIPEQILPNIFDRFVTHDIGNFESKGTGLGLYICKSIINAHGGKIYAKNNDNSGATFRIILPTICD